MKDAFPVYFYLAGDETATTFFPADFFRFF
jgi:hypothetical protein